MRIKFLTLLSLLAFTTLLGANNPPETIELPGAPHHVDVSCNLPHPNTVTIDDVGTDWVKATWTPIVGAAQYLVIVKKVSNNDPVSNTFIPGGNNTAQVSTVGANGEACYIQVYSVCTDGTYDTNNPPGTSPAFETIIVEIIISGIEVPGFSNPICTLGLGSVAACEYYWDESETPYRVTFTRNGVNYGTRNFSVRKFNKPGSGPRVQIMSGTTNDPNENNKITFYAFEGAYFIIKFKPDPNNNAEYVLATITTSHQPTSPVGLLYHYYTPAPGCVVERLLGGGSDTFQGTQVETINNSSDRDQTPASPQLLLAQPNPFNDAVTLQLPENFRKAGTTIHLYDLLGSFQRNFTLPTDQTELTFNTTDLKPGVYFLRVESDGIAETIKLVKAQ
jgi:hypothetical protein